MIGKTVAARIKTLFDKDTFTPLNPGQNNGFVTGCGKVDGCEVMASFIEPDQAPESLLQGLQDHFVLLEKAVEQRLPVVFIMDTPAMHKTTDKSPFPQDPIRLLAGQNGVGRWYSTHSRISGKVPQVVVVLNRLGAALTFPVTLCDAAVMLESAGMSIGRPDVVAKMTDQAVDYTQLGGPAMHYSTSGSIDHVAADEADAFAWVRNYLGCMTQNTKHESLAPELDAEALEKAVPATPFKAFDTHKVISGIADAGTLIELRAGIARELITGFGRIEGRLSGFVANNSAVRGGLFFPETCRKATRFVSICDAFGIPMVFLADNAGFMVGSQVEQAGVIKEASFLFSTIANAAVPKLSVAMRRDYTARVYAMAGPGFDPERFIALPGAVISIYGKGVAEKLATRSFDDKESDSLQEMMSGAEDPGKLLEMGLLDDVIEIGALRSTVVAFLDNVSDRVTGSGKPVLLV
jgi:acetyl-CoA carboxylase carboxyltransferase component